MCLSFDSQVMNLGMYYLFLCMKNVLGSGEYILGWVRRTGCQTEWEEHGSCRSRRSFLLLLLFVIIIIFSLSLQQGFIAVGYSHQVLCLFGDYCVICAGNKECYAGMLCQPGHYLSSFIFLIKKEIPVKYYWWTGHKTSSYLPAYCEIVSCNTMPHWWNSFM